MNSTQMNRVRHINEVIATLKKAKKGDVKVDEKKFVAAMQFDFGVTRRTALDYIAVAKSQL